MRDIDLAWLAGIWDGEGTITIFTHTEKNGSDKICPSVSMTNTDISIINKTRRILEELGCKFTIFEYRPKNPRHKLQWRLLTRNTKYIEIFLKAVLPFIEGEKKAKGEIVLSYVIQRREKMERFPSKGTTPYDEKDWSYYHKLRSSETTRQTAIADDIVRSDAKVSE